MKQCEKIRDFVKERVTTRRFAHSQRVADMAVRLARIHGLDETKAYLAAILHDLNRELPADKLLALANEYNIEVHLCEKKWPLGLHGKTAAKEAAKNFGIDSEIQEAIAYHVTGFPGMGKIARIIYLADKLEESRNYPGVENARKMAFIDYDKALIKTIDLSMLYLIERNLMIHPDTVEFRNSLLNEVFTTDQKQLN